MPCVTSCTCIHASHSAGWLMLLVREGIAQAPAPSRAVPLQSDDSRRPHAHQYGGSLKVSGKTVVWVRLIVLSRRRDGLWCSQVTLTALLAAARRGDLSWSDVSVPPECFGLHLPAQHDSSYPQLLSREIAQVCVARVSSIRSCSARLWEDFGSRSIVLAATRQQIPQT